MKILKLTALMFLFAFTCSAQMTTAKFGTWVQAPGDTVNMTNVLSANQVMEIMSVVVDETVAIGVTANAQTITLGRRARDLATPLPFVVAGPATVTFERTSTGGNGGLITYRIYEKERAVVLR